MSKLKKFVKKIDKAGRKLDENISKAIGLDDAKVSHLLNSDSIRHKEAVTQFKELFKDDDTSASSADNTLINQSDDNLEVAKAISLSMDESTTQGSNVPETDEDLELANALSLTEQESTSVQQAPVQSKEVKIIAEILKHITALGNEPNKQQVTEVVKEDLSIYNPDYLRLLYDAIDYYPGDNSYSESVALMALSKAMDEMNLEEV